MRGAVMSINVTQELKDELRKVRREKDILFFFAVDKVMESEGISRPQAEMKVCQEIFTQLQGVPR
jgi:hypothetical protein